MIKLSKRLETISSLIPKQSKVIDVGCDHGLLGIYLYQNNISKKIIASDINENALNNAKHNIEKYKAAEYVETRLGNGLDTLKEKDDIDTVVISGMGAHTAVGIIKKDINKLKKVTTVIVQSNTKIEFLRKELTNLNYLIEDEKLVEDNKKIYTIIKFIKGKKRYNKKELYFGPILMKENSKLFQKMKQEELKKLNMLLKILPKTKYIDRFKVKKKIKLYK